MDYAERLFKIKQLEYKLDRAENVFKVINDRWVGEMRTHALGYGPAPSEEENTLIAEISSINSQISKLLEDE